MNESLLEKLKSLGFKSGKDVTPPQSKRGVSIQDVIDGHVIQNSLGQFFLHEREYPENYLHGLEALQQAPALARISAYFKIPLQKRNKLLFLDTETSGLSGGTGTLAFLVGLSWWDNNKLSTQQLFLENPAQEPAMLLYLGNIAEQFDSVVTFNGKSFDIPILNTRYTLNRMESPFRRMGHIDLLHLSRQLWRERLDDRSLGSLERAILQFQRTNDDIPGWMVPEMYFEYQKTEDATKLEGVFYHNEIDVVSMAALLLRIDTLLEQQDDLANLDNRDIYSLARIMERLGDPSQALELYRNCNNVSSFDMQNKILSNSSKLIIRNGQYAEAIEYILNSNMPLDYELARRIAILFEHKLMDLTNAKTWALHCMKLIDVTEVRSKAKIEETQRRIERISLKLSRRQEL
ncbi:MAG TPA: ribonuclease H-like domain-containing protein [Bellilinea sp.]|nr:ribonuclease H-like domain-containing protein [Bellilinea sp.]